MWLGFGLSVANWVWLIAILFKCVWQGCKYSFTKHRHTQLSLTVSISHTPTPFFLSHISSKSKLGLFVLFLIILLTCHVKRTKILEPFFEKDDKFFFQFDSNSEKWKLLSRHFF